VSYLTDVTWKFLKTSPLAPLLAKERGTRKNSGSPSPCKEKGLGDVVHFSFHVTSVI
jgi:hypothetical protein